MITGPTAAGKTSLSIRLAEELSGEIISADSRQCYRYLDIGTAKPTEKELLRVPHHNISILDLNEKDSVAAFKRRAIGYAEEIESNEKTVIYCGGSTLHLQSIIKPLDEIPKSNPDHVRELGQIADDKGIEYLYNELQIRDPDYAKKMDGFNRQRIIRALDVWRQTGKPFSSFHSNKEIQQPENLMVFVIYHPRQVLHERISVRTDKMIEMGLLDEVRMILDRGYDKSIQALQTVGYREAIAHLNGEIRFDSMVKDIKTSTRRYAKRQITWFRRWPFSHRLNAGELNEDQLLNQVLQKVAANKQNR
tara:strand:- start:14697 stop:15614 length:918 start_codon:yes stop_codon:yes gene_type:complete